MPYNKSVSIKHMGIAKKVRAAAGAAKHTLKTAHKKMNLRWVIIGVCAVTAGIVMASVASYLWPRTVTFSYDGQNCFVNPVVLPGLTSAQNSSSFKAELKPAWSVGSVVMFSRETCITATEAPKPEASQQISLAPFNNSFIKKTLTVQAGKPPVLTARIVENKPLPTKSPLTFELSQADGTFDYALVANAKETPCLKKDMTVQCDLSKLELTQSTPYEFTLKRMFDGKQAEPVFTKTMTTVEAIGVVSTSITPGQKVFGVPTELVLKLNKPAATVAGMSLEMIGSDGKRTPQPVTQAIKDGAVIMGFAQALPRSATFEVKINSIESADGAYIPAPYTFSFTTSGGPQVAGINIGSSKVPATTKISLTFDSAIGPNQAYPQFIQLFTPAGQVAASVAVSGNRAVISPNAALPACTPLTVKVVDGIKSDVGVAGGSAWQFGSRTLCQTAFSIGTSHKGRGITAYRFGAGPSKVILVGALHGNEKSSAYTLISLIDHLEANPHQIPANRTVVIIPIVNPDGYATGSRLNANNVDLNRNFGTSNWKSSVTIPGGTYPQGGGTHPQSEPESQALGNYVRSQSPRLVLSYHSVGPLAAANEAGDSRSLATTYGKLARIPSYGNDANANFDYDTTGAFDDWLAEKYGIPSILIELSSHTSNEFSRHRDAILTMIQS